MLNIDQLNASFNDCLKKFLGNFSLQEPGQGFEPATPTLTGVSDHLDAEVCRKVSDVVLFGHHAVLGDGHRGRRHRVLAVHLGPVPG